MRNIRISFLGYSQDSTGLNIRGIVNGEFGNVSILESERITREEGYEVIFNDYEIIPANVVRLPKNVFIQEPSFGKQEISCVKALEGKLCFPRINGGPRLAKLIVDMSVTDDPHLLIAEPFYFGQGKPPMNHFIDALVEEADKRKVVVYSQREEHLRKDFDMKKISVINTSHQYDLVRLIKDEARRLRE